MAGARQPRKKKAAPSAADELRRQAEGRLDKLTTAAAAASPASDDIVVVIHELRMHQIELEMQNEELRRAQLELEEQRAKYFELFDLAPVGYLTLSDNSIVRDANLTAARLLGVERQQLIGQPFTAVVFAPDQDAYYRHHRVLETTGEPQTFELRLRHVGSDAKTDHFWAHVEGRPQPAVDGEALSCWVTFADVDERVMVREELARLNDEIAARAAALEAANATITRIAGTDYLTGLANRRHFYESLVKAVSLARRHHSPLALASLDLDGLKRVNDSSGHMVGDEVLIAFADLLGSMCRIEDLPARLGGDEFGVLLPGTDLSGARGLAERLLGEVRSCAALEQRGITVSGGIAQWSHDELADDLLRRGDEALYAAKHCGGDSVAVDG